jgi:hypothetical protein
VSPLTAAQAASRIDDSNVNPDQDQNPAILHLLLKYDGVTFVPEDLYKVLTSIWGPPKMKTPSASRRLYSMIFGGSSEADMVGSNGIANHGFEVNATGWATAGVGTPTITRDTVEHLVGVGSLKVVTGSAGASEGASSTTSAELPNAPNRKVVAGVWVKGNAGGEALKVELLERDAADALVGSASSANFVATTGWKYYQVTRTFGATGVKARVRVTTQGAATVTYFMDNAHIGIADDSAITDNEINPDWSAQPTIVEVTCKVIGLPVVPDLIFDAFDDAYPTVSSDKDEIARGTYQLTISP